MLKPLFNNIILIFVHISHTNIFVGRPKRHKNTKIIQPPLSLITNQSYQRLLLRAYALYVKLAG